VPYFAGLQLKSNWGLSSEVEFLSLQMFKEASASGASLLFTPTTALRDPLESQEYAYVRFKLVSEGPEGLVLLTRPLSTSVREAKAILEQRCGESKVVLSLAVSSLAEAHQLLEEVDREPDAYEIDVNLTCLLSGKGIAYAVELAKELSATLARPLIAKFSAASISTLDFDSVVAESGVSAIAITPNVVYRIGNHFFRLSIPPYISTPLLVGIAESLSELDIGVAYVVQHGKSDLLELVPLKLYDATYVLHWMRWKGSGKWHVSAVPLAWRSISRKLKVYARKGAGFCPYGLIRGEGFVEGCNYCGVCFELNEPGSVELAALLSP